MPRTTRPTYMAQWNASYQRQLPGNWLASVTYLGNKTTHLWVGSEVNPAIYGPGATTGNTNQRRILYLQSPAKGINYASINQADEGSNAHYNALLLSMQHRFTHGFTLITNYTNSYCVTDLDFTGELGGAPNSVPGNRSADRGPCNFDYRHIFNAGLVATSSYKGGKPWVNHLLSNWRLSPNVRATSGPAISVTSGKDNSLNGTNNDRPVQIAANVYPDAQSAKQWILPLGVAFMQNATGTTGNVGRDALRGPGNLGVDVGLSRIFAITERYRVEARFESFNAINHVNLNNPTTNLSSSTFGTITAAGDPRILQFAMKLHW
jgi:hypothetical protein